MLDDSLFPTEAELQLSAALEAAPTANAMRLKAKKERKLGPAAAHMRCAGPSGCNSEVLFDFVIIHCFIAPFIVSSLPVLVVLRVVRSLRQAAVGGADRGRTTAALGRAAAAVSG